MSTSVLNKLNFLIIGSNGFIGSNLSSFLNNKGHTVFKSNRIDSNSDFDWSNKKIDYCIHCASTLIPSSSSEEFYDEFFNLIEPTFLLIDRCEERKIPFIFISSGGAIYSDSNDYLSEKSAMSPSTFYGLSKLIIENYILEKAKEELKYMVLRPTNVYGRDIKNINKNQGFIENTVFSIINDETIKLFGDISNERDYIYIDDFIKGVYQLICNAQLNSIYNVGSGHLCSLNDLIKKISQILGKEANISILDEREFDKKSIKINVNLFKELITFKTLDIDQGLKLYISKITSIKD
jgi:UDP-glucose 4-epimerase